MNANEWLNRSLMDENFSIQTQLQIAKDFRSVGILFPEFQEAKPLSGEIMRPLLQRELEKSWREDAQKFVRLLYRIDVNEAVLHKLSSTPDFMIKLSETVLRREAYKVHFRSRHKASKKIEIFKEQ